MNTTMTGELKVSIAKIARLGLVKDWKMGANQERAERIKAALKWTAGNNADNS